MVMQSIHLLNQTYSYSKGHAHSPSLQSIQSSVTDVSNNSADTNINDDAENTMLKMSSSKMFGN